MLVHFFLHYDLYYDLLYLIQQIDILKRKFVINFISNSNNKVRHNAYVFQPVGFVTFNTRAGAEAAKQDLQVGFIL